MKKILSPLFLLFVVAANTQTNTFPSSGNVGIGTVSPSSKIHIYKGASGGSPHGFSHLTVEEDGAGMISILTPNSQTGYFGFADNDDDFVGGMQYSHITNEMRFRVNNHASDMVINKDGYVGIGTTSPGRRLDVVGEIRSISGSDRMSLGSDDTNSLSEIQWGDDSNDRFRFYYNDWNGTSKDKEVMSLFSNGNVGIGTIAPDAKLTVKGDIHAEEVKVDLSVPGPDYVFKEGYELRTLEEVQRHIKEHGHLPDIPSAREMEENGIQLGEMNMKLLEKIEELTLYIIEMKKEHKKHAQLIEHLQNEIAITKNETFLNKQQ